MRLQEQGVHFFDAWYLDDGQPFCRPEHVDVILRTLDEEAARVGASRATGEDAKSVARVIGRTDAAWETAYVSGSVTREPSRQFHVLGVDFGEEFSPSHQFRGLTQQVKELHEALSTVNFRGYICSSSCIWTSTTT